MKERIKRYWQNKYIRYGGAGLLLLIVGWYWLRGESAPQFDYIKVERGDIRVLLQETGNLAAYHRLSVTSPIAGRIDSILVEEGTDVTKGTTLAYMSSTERAALIDAARAKGPEEVAYWEDIYKPAPLLAPLDGHLIAIKIVPGQVVVAAQDAFVMSDRIILQAYVDETDLHSIRDQHPVEFYLSGYSTTTKLTGKVFQIAYDSTSVNNVTTYMIKIAIDNPPDFLRSGLTADVYFIMEDAKGVLKVPSEFITVDNTVLVATGEGREPEQRTVKVGVNDGNYTEVAEGLQDGDWVARRKFNLQEAKQGFSFGPKFKAKEKKR